MPTTFVPSSSILPDGAAVSTLVDGDRVNRDNLYVETAPATTKKLTLGLVASWATSIWASVGSLALPDYAGGGPGSIPGTLGAWTGKTVLSLLKSIVDTAVSLELLGTNGASPSGSALVGLAEYAGAQHSILTGGTTVEAHLQKLADKVPWISNSLVQFTGALRSASFSTTGSITGASYTSSGPVKKTAGAYDTTDPILITNTATTASMNVISGSYYRAVAWHGTGDLLTVTLDVYGGTEEPVMELVFHPALSGKSLKIWQPSAYGGQLMAWFEFTSGVGCTVRVRLSQALGRWTYEGPGPFDPTNTTIHTLNP